MDATAPQLVGSPLWKIWAGCCFEAVATIGQSLQNLEPTKTWTLFKKDRQLKETLTNDEANSWDVIHWTNRIQKWTPIETWEVSGPQKSPWWHDVTFRCSRIIETFDYQDKGSKVRITRSAQDQELDDDWEIKGELKGNETNRSIQSYKLLEPHAPTDFSRCRRCRYDCCNNNTTPYSNILQAVGTILTFGRCWSLVLVLGTPRALRQMRYKEMIASLEQIKWIQDHII